MGKKEVTYKSRVDWEKALGYLDELLAGLKSGTVYVQNGREYVALHPGGPIDLEVAAVEKKGKQRVSIELGWLSQEEPTEPQPELKITTSEPEIEEEYEEEDEVEEVEGNPAG